MHRVNIYTVYELGASGSNDSDPTRRKCLFGAVTLTKNTDIEKYGYSGYGIGFDRRSAFSIPGGGFGQNVLMFGVDMSSFAQFKARDSEIVVGPICLGNISKDWSVDNMKKTGFTGYVYDFSIDYDPTAVDDIKNIHKYLMRKNNIV